MNANKFEISNFICIKCGNSFPLPRPQSCRRGKNHIKDLWCPSCRNKVKMIEIRPRDTFKSMSGEIYY